jgi:hypothetical protein
MRRAIRGGRIAALRAADLEGGCLLGNQTRDFVADFLIAILRPSELGSATN